MNTDMPERYATQNEPDAKSGKTEGVSYGGRTDKGRKRNENQDSFAFSTLRRGFSSEKGFLMAVADGMGGHLGGAVASRLALGILVSEYCKMEPRNIRTALEKAFVNANEAVYTLANDDDNYERMGTTMTAAVIKDCRMHFAHVGDSRGYIVDKKKIEQFTSDHSYVASLVRAGAITPEEAVNHPADNVITRAVGLAPDIQVDISEKEIVLKKGQVVLLCSDGLFKTVPDHDIADVVGTWITPDLISKKLVELANERGGPDNITVVVARIEKNPGLFKKIKRLTGLTK